MIDYSCCLIETKKSTPQEKVLENFMFIHLMLIFILLANYLGN